MTNEEKIQLFDKYYPTVVSGMLSNETVSRDIPMEEAVQISAFLTERMIKEREYFIQNITNNPVNEK